MRVHLPEGFGYSDETHYAYKVPSEPNSIVHVGLLPAKRGCPRHPWASFFGSECTVCKLESNLQYYSLMYNKNIHDRAKAKEAAKLVKRAKKHRAAKMTIRVLSEEFPKGSQVGPYTILSSEAFEDEDGRLKFRVRRGTETMWRTVTALRRARNAEG